MTEPAIAPAADGATGSSRKWWVLAVLASVAFMAQLDLFIVNIALPAMTASFRGAGLSDLSWVLNAYAIVFAALLVPAGRLADHFGRRRFLLAGVVVLTLASALCAVAPTLAAVFAFSSGRIAGRLGRAVPALASTLPADRVTTGSAVPTMARQIGSAIGVAVLVALLATSDPHSLALFHRGWILEASAALAAAVAIVIMRPRPARGATPGGPPGGAAQRAHQGAAALRPARER